MSNVFTGLQHLNGDLLCAIDVETTGLNIDKHNILSIAIVPLNELLEPHSKVQIFSMEMRPEDDEEIDPQAISVNKLDLAKIKATAFDRETVATAFLNWFAQLQLAPGKMIAPLGHNYPFDRDMIRKWLGPETYNLHFHYHFRDSMVSANFLNDRAACCGDKVPYSKINLKYLAGTLGVDLPNAHHALDDALAASKCYKKLLLS